MAKKTCTLCSASKPISQFPKGGKNADGSIRYRSNCKVCDRARKRRQWESKKKRAPRVDVPVVTPSKARPKKNTRYVVTYAQNATPVHEAFLQSLKVYCQANNATLIVIAGRYSNPTSIWSVAAKHDDWWAAEVVPYLHGGRFMLGSQKVFADISIIPTAETPTSGFDGFVGQASGIFGHPKVSRRPIPSADRRARTLTTTGSITVPNYIPSKAGAKGQHHHVIGALVVEVGAKATHIRHVHYDHKREGFYDLDFFYGQDEVVGNQAAQVITFGDIHAYQIEEDIENAVWGPEGIVDTLNPDYHIFHDLYDHWAVNHHDGPRNRYAKINRGQDRVEDEIELTIDWLDKHAPMGKKSFVIASNHDEGLDRWLDNTHPLSDMRNARTWINLWKDRIDAWERDGHWSSAFSLAYRKYGRGHVSFLARDEPLVINEVMHHFHGDKGINGARASSRSYAKLGNKATTGHSHSPEIRDGLYVVGVMGPLNMGYNYLPSTWQQTLCVQYQNGHRALIDITDGEWRA